MTRTGPPGPTVLGAFGLSGEPTVLSGGMDPAFLVDGIVFKRADPPDEVGWKSELLSRMPESGYRLARPVAARSGAWTAEGWMASRYVEGAHAPPRWAELVRAARAFHAALASEPRPDFLDRLGHRWARAHRVAWGRAEIHPLAAVGPRLAALAALVQPDEGRCQLVHADLAGNVLFSDARPPAILDFSPWWAPVAYAEGILFADALLWYGAGRSILDLAADRGAVGSWLARGAVFRLVALNEGVQEGHPEYQRDLERFDDLISLIHSL